MSRYTPREEYWITKWPHLKQIICSAMQLIMRIIRIETVYYEKVKQNNAYNEFYPGLLFG